MGAGCFLIMEIVYALKDDPTKDLPETPKLKYPEFCNNIVKEGKQKMLETNFT